MRSDKLIIRRPALRMRSESFTVLHLALLTWVLLVAGCGSKSRDHVILITMDTTRADRIGCYGYELASTPALDSLSTRSTLFANAQVSAPNTLPSHMTILTGHSPIAHGVRYNGWHWKVPGVATLAEVLSDAGFTTAAFISAAPLKREFGTSVGFQTFDDEIGVRVERPDAETADRAIAFLRTRPVGPLFLWVHFFDPHDPYEAPEPFASQTRGTNYDAEISSMDHEIGRLLAALEELGYAEKSHVVAVSDHGEGLLDRPGYTNHGLLLYEEAVRAAFLWHVPGQQAGRVDSTLVGCVDIYPTVLDVLGLALDEPREGLSLEPVLRGDELDERNGVYVETIATHLLHRWSPLYGWRTRDHKYIAASVPELYDLRRDPDELDNIAEMHPEQVERLQRELASYLDRWGQTEATKIETVDQQDRELLESLGYIQPSQLRNPEDVQPTYPMFEDLGGLASPRDHIREEETFVKIYYRRKRNDWEEVVDACESVLQRLPESPAVPFPLAEALHGLGRPQEALSWIDRHLSLRPDDPPAHRLRSDVLMSLGRFAEAKASYDRVPIAESDVALRRSRLALALILGNEESVERELRALRGMAFPTLLDSWKDAAAVIRELGVDRPAPNDADLGRQVQALETLEVFDRARALTAAAEGSHPDSLLARLRGDIAFASNDWDAAVAAYSAAQAMGVRNLTERIEEAERRHDSKREPRLPRNTEPSELTSPP